MISEQLFQYKSLFWVLGVALHALAKHVATDSLLRWHWNAVVDKKVKHILILCILVLRCL